MSGECVYLCYFACLILYKLTDTGTKHCCTDQSGNTADHVDAVGTCEIVEADLGKPAAAPCPVCFDRINDCGNDSGVHTVGNELCTFCHCTGYDGSGCCTEHKVEYEV